MTAPPPPPESRRSAMRTGVAVVITLVVVAFVLLAAWIGYMSGRVIDTTDAAVTEVLGEGDYTRVGPVTVQTIRSLAELTTVEMVQYTTIEKGDDRGWLNWAAGDRIAMFAVARIGAGVDLQELGEADLYTDPSTGEAVIRLPPADITYVAVDNEATHVYDRETGVFTRGDPNLERAARLAAEEVLTQQALDNGLLEMAEERAVDVISQLLESLGYTEVEVVVRG